MLSCVNDKKGCYENVRDDSSISVTPDYEETRIESSKPQATKFANNFILHELCPFRAGELYSVTTFVLLLFKDYINLLVR